MTTQTNEKPTDPDLTVDSTTNIAVSDTTDINPQTVEYNNVDGDEVAEAITSLEEFRQLLTQAGPDGLNGQSGAILRVALRSIDRVIGYDTPVPGLESFDGSPRSALRKANVSLEDITDRIQKGVAKAKEMLGKLLAWLKAQWTDAKSRYAKVDALQSTVTAAVKAAPTGKAESLTFTIQNPKHLYVGGELDLSLGSEVKAITWLKSAHMKWVLEGMTFASKLVSTYQVEEGNAEDFFRTFGEARRSWFGTRPTAGLTIAGGYVIDYKDEHSSSLALQDDDRAAPKPVGLEVRDRSALDQFVSSSKAMQAAMGGLFDLTEGASESLEDVKAYAMPYKTDQGAVTGMHCELHVIHFLQELLDGSVNAVIRQLSDTQVAKLRVVNQELGLLDA
jgi:hypothetical protein